MSVLIIAESYFGNTQTIAQAVATGLTRSLDPDVVTILHPDQAPFDLPVHTDLLLVGAPTHDYSMPKAQTRRQAATKGATGRHSIGVREWIAGVTPRPDLRALTFDTSLEMRFSLGSASKAAHKALKKRGFAGAERGKSFLVTGTAGPLATNEELRAQAWGEQLAASLHR